MLCPDCPLAEEQEDSGFHRMPFAILADFGIAHEVKGAAFMQREVWTCSFSET
jgi:hypothetical protein